MNKATRVIVLTLALIMIAGALMPVAAARPYQTYINDKDGFGMNSPDAYVPDYIIDSKRIGLGPDELNAVELDSPQDLTVDEQQNLYLADTKANRILVTNPDGTFKFAIDEFINE